MAVELVKEKYAGAINTVEIGVGPKAVKVGGQTAMPMLTDEGSIPNKPVTAMEVIETRPSDWSPRMLSEYCGDAYSPVKWAKRCAQEFGARLLSIRLLSPHQDWGGASIESAVATLKDIAEAVDIPLIVTGCGDDQTDNLLLPMASIAMKGKNCLFGIASQENYKTLSATCLADGHSIIADSPIDVNIAKQLNILISDMGFDPARIVMHPTTTSLGYGMEYVYSIMERARLAAFLGDKTLAMPFILFTGQETWKTRESRESGESQAINWEVATSAAMIQSGADMIVVRHPEANKILNEHISMLY